MPSGTVGERLRESRLRSVSPSVAAPPEALPGEWVIDVDASADALARAQYRPRQTTLIRRDGDAPATREVGTVIERFDPKAYREALSYWLGVLDNPDWDALPHLPHLTQPTLVIAGDPDRGALFAGDLAAHALAANPLIEQRTVPGGHNVHRDAPGDTLEAMHDWLADF